MVFIEPQPIQFLPLQQQLYPDPNLPTENPSFAIHPVTGEWQDTDRLRSKYPWGGGASNFAFKQLPAEISPHHFLGTLVFGPVQSFLGAGQRLRDWAVASWLCHYLATATIYHWEKQGGSVLLPLYRSSPLLRWMNTGVSPDPQSFWRSELPNVMTGVVPCTTDEAAQNWLENIKHLLLQEWSLLIKNIERVVVEQERTEKKRLLDGVGWQVIHRDHGFLWSVYYTCAPITQNPPLSITQVNKQIHDELEKQKLSRQWQGTWWSGVTSPTAGSLSVWHPGLLPIDRNGTWGIPPSELDNWWAGLIGHHSALFSSREKLNSIELIKRLASLPNYIQKALEMRWGHIPPACPWGNFPEQTAVAAAWVPLLGQSIPWNDRLQDAAEYFELEPKPWGLPLVDRSHPGYVHPQLLERRNLENWSPNQDLEGVEQDWKDFNLDQWTTPIQWHVGWRGDGDHIGQWLSGSQYERENLLWQKWHPTPQQIENYHLNLVPAQIPNHTHRQLDLPHVLDLSVLFSHWNKLLYPLVEEQYPGKVIFAGGDDFLLLGPLPQAVEMTSDLYRLWSGRTTALTSMLEPPVPGWVKYQESVYPVPSEIMTFSLGVVIAQRRIPQALWHSHLNEAYKKAKSQGRNRVCVRVLFNSNQIIEWICPWFLWDLLMANNLVQSDNQLNRWEKLLQYMEPVRMKQPNLALAETALETLWQSVGLNLSWNQVRPQSEHDTFLSEWEWWTNWVALRVFLARQEQNRDLWMRRFREDGL